MASTWKGKVCGCGRAAVAFAMNAPVCKRCKSWEATYYNFSNPGRKRKHFVPTNQDTDTSRSGVGFAQNPPDSPRLWVSWDIPFEIDQAH